MDAPRFLEKGNIGQDALRCTMCHACEWACPSGIALTRSMLMLRSEMSQERLPGHRRMIENVSSFGRTVSTEFNGRTPSAAEAWKLTADDVAQVVVDLVAHNPRSLPSRVEIRPAMPPK